jgi:hypothetical protein
LGTKASEDLMKEACNHPPDFSGQAAANLPIQTTIDGGRTGASKIPVLSPSC